MKLTYQFVKSFIENERYTLISTEYVNSHEKLIIKCDKEHIFDMRFNNFKDMNQRCPICSGKQKYTYEFVKSFIEKEGYTLLSTEYKNNNTKLLIECENGHVYKSSFTVFKNGHRCPECIGLKKYTYEFVKSFIENERYTLISKEYKNNNTKMYVMCNNNHIYETTFYNFKSGHRCPECIGNKKLTIQYVKKHINNFGYTLLSTEYKNNNTKLLIECPNKHLFKMRFADFQQGQRCPCCLRIHSKQEKEIVDLVKKIYHKDILENDRSLIKNPLTGKMLELDIYLPNDKKAIEFNGEYWHNNNYQKFKDLEKIKQCKEKSIKLLIILYTDWINNKNLCKKKIIEFINE
jgi:hypothetical protein